MAVFQEDIIRQIKYIPRAIILAGFLVIILLFFQENTIQQAKSEIKKLIKNYRVVLFLLYMSFLLVSTIFSRWPKNPTNNIFGGFGIYTSKGWNKESVENVLLFIPYIFLYLVAFRPAKPFKSSLFVTVATTVSIELLQLLFWFGSFQISDMIHNIYGGVLGWSLWYLVKWIKDYRKKHKKFI